MIEDQSPSEPARLCACGARITAQNPKADKCRDCYEAAREALAKRYERRFDLEYGGGHRGYITRPARPELYERPENFE